MSAGAGDQAMRPKSSIVESNRRLGSVFSPDPICHQCNDPGAIRRTGNPYFGFEIHLSSGQFGEDVAGE